MTEEEPKELQPLTKEQAIQSIRDFKRQLGLDKIPPPTPERLQALLEKMGDLET